MGKNLDKCVPCGYNQNMLTVGIRNLRNSLSKYVNLAKNGEKVIITDHNKIVAEIVPPETEQKESGMFKTYVQEQVEAGSIIQATNNHQIEPKKATLNQNTEIMNIYDETRSERV